ncbi:MAG: hypothetical protein CGW95_13590 [Phenylobacterium zucineum]|nr:MAG: hypothetical protein CGW95_13590 [Phenylobacterium zucineum]
MTRYRSQRRLLKVAMFAPIFAFGAVTLAVLAYPNFNHARQYLSELGGAHALHPAIFNTGVIVSGIGAALGGIGFGLTLLALGGGRLAALVTALCFVLAGIGMVIASLFPWPDPRHLAINLGLGIQLAPLALIWGLRTRPGLRGLRRFLGLVFVVMAILTILTKHLIFKGLVNDFNVGWWERAFAFVLVGWTGVAAFILERRLLALEREFPVSR